MFFCSHSFLIFMNCYSKNCLLRMKIQKILKMNLSSNLSFSKTMSRMNILMIHFIKILYTFSLEIYSFFYYCFLIQNDSFSFQKVILPVCNLESFFNSFILLLLQHHNNLKIPFLLKILLQMNKGLYIGYKLSSRIIQTNSQDLILLYFFHSLQHRFKDFQTLKSFYNQYQNVFILNFTYQLVLQLLKINIFKKNLKIANRQKMVKFSLKVGKESFQVEHSKQQTFEDFQAKVFALSDIPPKNLKILFKAKMIKDNQSLLEIGDGSQLIIMGTKSGKQLKKTGQIMIQQKMEQQNPIIKRYGFVNIGNTCYMNAGLQMLKSVPQFKQLLLHTTQNQQNNPASNVSLTLKNVIKELDVSDVTPKMFVALFLNSNPQFQPFGTQQDSDQFTQKVLQTVSSLSPQHQKKIKQTFEIQFFDTMKNLQIPQQQQQISTHSTLKLCCSLGGVQKQIKIGTLMEGIKLSLQSKIQKLSPLDNINHCYQNVSRFNKLPSYLMVQMVRFFWKAASDLPNAKPVAVKICKSIDFSTKLDLYDYCTPDLKSKLQKGRQAYEINKKKEEQNYKTQYQNYKKSLGDTNRPESRTIEQFKQKWKKKKIHLEDGLQTGMYEITAVVTHLGHSIESGHYMAWVKENDQEWTKYDDDNVYQQPSEKVTQLRGGQPNLEIAYLLLFRKVFTQPLQ